MTTETYDTHGTFETTSSEATEDATPADTGPLLTDTYQIVVSLTNSVSSADSPVPVKAEIPAALFLEYYDDESVQYSASLRLDASLTDGARAMTRSDSPATTLTLLSAFVFEG